MKAWCWIYIESFALTYGVACAQIAPCCPSLIVRSISVGATGAAKRRFPVGGAA
jgi:hypothetical protein